MMEGGVDAEEKTSDRTRLRRVSIARAAVKNFHSRSSAGPTRYGGATDRRGEPSCLSPESMGAGGLEARRHRARTHGRSGRSTDAMTS
jgi:hypothetical protein